MVASPLETESVAGLGDAAAWFAGSDGALSAFVADSLSEVASCSVESFSAVKTSSFRGMSFTALHFGQRAFLPAISSATGLEKLHSEQVKVAIIRTLTLQLARRD